LLKKYPNSGLPFLGQWCARDNLRNILIDSFGSLDILDQYFPLIKAINREVRVFPKGLVVHWMTGNVPTLGLLSLVSGILTRNSNLVRLPSLADGLLADLIAHLYELGNIHKVLARAIAIIRYDHNDKDIAESISRSADARIIWGGDESAMAIKSLPTKTTCLDMVFPDRTSFSIVGNSELSGDRLDAVTRLIAHDVSVFEQKACASPHTVFISTNDDTEVEIFCQALAKAMEHILKTIPKQTPSQKEVMAILNLRTQYDMFHDAWYPQGTEFTILSDNNAQLGPPIGNRTVYVRKLPEDGDLVAILPKNIQSVGITADREEFERITTVLGAAGVHRFTPLGAMTHFEIPWDGIDIPQYLVRRTTRQSPKDNL
jgi:hypothetical protein